MNIEKLGTSVSVFYSPLIGVIGAQNKTTLVDVTTEKYVDFNDVYKEGFIVANSGTDEQTA